MQAQECYRALLPDVTLMDLAMPRCGGIEAIRAFRAARPAAGLARDLRHTTITTFGADMAVCSTEFTREGSARLG
ncbi:DUF3225 domain-containing protein, partial [Acinetobacter baumannii]|nr:DUF3225 domain-containing protein [Acinetobacter baumannii]